MLTEPAQQPVQQVGVGGGDRCQNCQAPLASDQRYCVNCGTRRGKSRFSLESVAAQATPPPAPAPTTKKTARRLPAGVTLVTGVATLLLAMGVGVLIGHDSNSPAPQRASAPIVVNGGAASPTTATGTTSTTASAGANKNKSQGKTATGPSAAQLQKQTGVKPTVVKVTTQSKQQAAAAATKVFGQKSHLSKNPTVQVGQSCSGGAGCQNGKFTGNFFH
jgi:hypothetical protein